MIADRAAGKPTRGLKDIRPEILNQVWEAKDPVGIKGQGAIAFGGGAVLSKEGMKVLREADAAQFDEGQDSAASMDNLASVA